jgi:hypothetical protein
MAPIPTPVRAALGLMASAVETARTLPDRVVELPVLAVSTALQVSLRAQQRYAELTLRGDELIGRLHGPPEEPPSWATFDDEGTDVPAVDAPPPDAAAAGAAADTPPPPDIPITEPAERGTTTADEASVRSAAKQPRKPRSAGKKSAKAAAKTVRPRRLAKPSAFDDASAEPQTPPD